MVSQDLDECEMVTSVSHHRLELIAQLSTTQQSAGQHLNKVQSSLTCARMVPFITTARDRPVRAIAVSEALFSVVAPCALPSAALYKLLVASSDVNCGSTKKPELSPLLAVL
jgi:hypothetical protein